MGLVKKWQIEKSNTLSFVNNLAEIKDNSVTLDKLAFKTMVLEASAEGSGTSVEFTNTTVSDGIYMAVIEVTSGMNVYIYFNGDTTSSNYYRQQIFGNGDTASAYRGNDALLTTGPAIAYILKDKSDYAKAIGLNLPDYGSSTDVCIRHVCYVNTVTDITSIQLTFGSTVDYRVSLYKLKV